jgi:hypothetical protein
VNAPRFSRWRFLSQTAIHGTHALSHECFYHRECKSSTLRNGDMGCNAIVTMPPSITRAGAGACTMTLSHARA